MIKALAHLCIFTKDLARTKSFYCDALGFQHHFDFLKDGQLFGFYLQVAPQQFVEFWALERAIQYQAHRPFRGMGAEIDHALGEARVFHGRHRDQQLAGQEVSRGRRGRGFARLDHADESGPAGASVQASRRGGVTLAVRKARSRGLASHRGAKSQ